MNSLRIDSVGVATFQDLGRGGYELDGVSPAGVSDEFAFKCLAALIEEDLALLSVVELLQGEFSATNMSDVALDVAVVGASRVTMAGHAASPNTAFQLPPGSTLKVVSSSGSPAWIAVRGLEVPRVLGSSSRDTLGCLGPELLVGQLLNVRSHSQSTAGRFIRPTTPVRPAQPNIFRYIAGPHSDLFNLSLSMTAVTSLSRSGVRLSTPMPEAHQVSLSSMPVRPGVVQLPPDGQPIILGKDSGVTGGYPVVGTIISADIRQLAWLKPADRLTFVQLTPAQAATALIKQQQELAIAATDLSRRP